MDQDRRPSIPASNPWAGGPDDDAGPAVIDPGETATPVRTARSRRPHRRAPLSEDWAYSGHVRSIRLPGRRLLLSVGLVIVLTAGALAYLFLGREPAGGTALALSFREGQTYRYELGMSLDATVTADGRSTSTAMDVNGAFSWAVVSVDHDGMATVDMSIDVLRGTVDGQPIPADTPGSVRIQITRDGRILTGGSGPGLALGGGEGLFLPGTDQLTPILPDHPVDVGDSWSTTFDQEAPFLVDGSLRYTVENTLVRYDQIDGKRVAVITTKLRLPLDMAMSLRELAELAAGAGQPLPEGSDPRIVVTGSASFEGTSWLEVDDGELVRVIGDVEFDMGMRLEGLEGLGAGAPPVDQETSFVGTMHLALERAAVEPEEAPDRAAQALLRNAMVAAQVHFIESDSYGGFDAARGAELEPSITWATAKKAAIIGKVGIHGVGPRTIVLVTKSAGGTIFCIADDQGRGITYGKVNAFKVSGCTGGW